MISSRIKFYLSKIIFLLFSLFLKREHAYFLSFYGGDIFRSLSPLEKNVLKRLSSDRNSYSEFGQDLIADEIRKHFQFKEKRIAEIGVGNGILGSNSFMFSNMGMKAILIEPCASLFKELQINRSSCELINFAAGSKNEEVDFYEDKEVKTHSSTNIDSKVKDFVTYKVTKKKTSDLLHNQGLLYLSVDVEGDELDVLKGIDFTRHSISIISVEYNYDFEKLIALKSFLSEKGYECLSPSLTRVDLFFYKK